MLANANAPLTRQQPVSSRRWVWGLPFHDARTIGTSTVADLPCNDRLEVRPCRRGKRPTQGESDWNGEDTLSLEVTDKRNTGAGEALTAVGELAITVSPVNDPPEIFLDPEGLGLLPAGGALGLDEDSSLSLALLSVTDKEIVSDGVGRITMSLHCFNGGFALATPNALEENDAPAMTVMWAVGGLAEGDGVGPWPDVVFSSGLAEANHMLSGLEYVPRRDWHGVDDLKVGLHQGYKFASSESRLIANHMRWNSPQ